MSGPPTAKETLVLISTIHRRLAQLRLTISKIHLRLAQLRLTISKIHLRLAQLRLTISKIHLRLAQLRLTISTIHRRLAQLRLTISTIHRRLAHNEIMSISPTATEEQWTKFHGAPGDVSMSGSQTLLKHTILNRKANKEHYISNFQVR